MFSDSLTHRTMEGIIRANRIHHAMCDRETAEVGVHRSQNRMLAYLFREGAMSQKKIADLMHITPAVVTVTVQKLLEDGYVERLENKDDRRACLICITDKGREVVERTHHILDRVDSVAFDGFSEEEMETLLSLCNRMIHNMEYAEPEEETP